MTLRKLLITTLVFVVATTLFAYDTNSQSVREALQSSRVSFIGRVIELREVEHIPLMSEAIAVFEVATPLYGANIRQGGQVRVKYHARYHDQTSREGFSVLFRMSEYYLVTLKNDFINKSSAYEFSSEAGNRADIAYWVTDQQGSQTFTASSTEHYYRSIYDSGNKQYIELNQLVRWAAK